MGARTACCWMASTAKLARLTSSSMECRSCSAPAKSSVNTASFLSRSRGAHSACSCVSSSRRLLHLPASSKFCRATALAMIASCLSISTTKGESLLPLTAGSAVAWSSDSGSGSCLTTSPSKMLLGSFFAASSACSTRLSMLALISAAPANSWVKIASFLRTSSRAHSESNASSWPWALRQITAASKFCARTACSWTAAAVRARAAMGRSVLISQPAQLAAASQEKFGLPKKTSAGRACKEGIRANACRHQITGV